MPFPRDKVEVLLAACHRRCCICHRFCGVKIETDHIVPDGEGGSNDIENAIPVCFECHAEIHSYNNEHPRGRKFQPNELRIHREQWLEICKERPEVFVGVRRDSEVGPVQALIDELEFNAAIAQYPAHDSQGCLFHDEQFRRAIQEGAIAILDDGLRGDLVDAYVAIGRANQHLSAVNNHEPKSNAWGESTNRATDSIINAKPKIDTARKALLDFLRSPN